MIESARLNGNFEKKQSGAKGYGWIGRVDVKRHPFPNWRSLPRQLKQERAPFATVRFQGASQWTTLGLIQ